jgi:cytoskeletal protein RodZ
VTGHGPPDDPSEAPTGYYDYSNSGDDGHQPNHRRPWYRSPIVLVALGLFAAILLGLVLYFLADQTHGSGGPTQTPTSPTTSTAAATTEAPTTTAPVAPAPTTTMTFPPTTAEPTTTAPATTPTTSTSVNEGRHHHHHHDGGTP